MIDIHSHILWDIDDGPATFEESLAMLRKASDSGTTDIVATPHANLRYPFDPARSAERIDQLRRAVATPRIHAGCEFLFTYDNVQRALDQPTAFTINGLSYLLIEFSHLFLPASLDLAFRQFADRGIHPIIAHPERNPALSERQSEIAAWIECGCVLQITGQSLDGTFGPAACHFAWSLLESGQAQVVASDAHDPDHRTPALDSARTAIERRLGASAAQRLLVANPAAILEGSLLPLPPKPSRKSLFRFWR